MNIESHGVNSVPLKDRTATWADLFMIWSGVSLCLPSFIVGALLVPAFSWGEALLINFLGNLAVGLLIVLGGYFGVKTGCPAVIYGRSVFGEPLGQWLPTILLVFSTLGWFAVMTAMTGAALDGMVKAATGFSSPAAMTVAVGVLNACTSVMGYQKIRRLGWLSVPLLAVLCIWMAIELYSHADITAALQYRPTGSLSFGEGMDIIIGGYVAGAFAASDFSRYARGSAHNWLGTLPGTFFISFLLGILGMLSVAATGDWNPVLVVQDMGMGAPALVFILLANWTTSTNLLYSSGLALTNVLPGPGRARNTVVPAIAGTAMAVAGITNFLEPWLVMLSMIISPLVGVILTDFFLIKRKDGPGPVNISALLAVGAGICAAFITPPQFISSLAGLVAGSLAYLVLSKACEKKVRSI